MNSSSSFRSAFDRARPYVPGALFALCILAFVALLGAGFYMRGRTLMEEQLRERLRETAAVSALQFDPEVIQSIRSEESIGSPELKDVVTRLRSVRQSVPGIRYAYIMRKTEEPEMLEFVADADSLSPDSELDENRDGILQEEEEASYPGDTYNISGITALHDDAFSRASVDQEITVDQWGYLISGYAPIIGADGNTVAVLGLDMDAAEFVRLTRSIFSPVAFLLLCVMSMLFAGYILLYLHNRRRENLAHIERERAGLLLLTSHQLGTPLTIFQWSLESLREGITKGCDPVAMEKDLENMETGCNKLKDILGNLRTATLAENGKFPWKPEPGYLRSLIVEVIHDASAELKLKEQKVTVDADGSLHLSFDHRLIGDVLRELLLNAMTFSPAGAVISVTARRQRGMAQVEVRDRGTGIAKKDLPRLFQKFMRGQDAHLSRPDGYGMGLFIAKSVIDKAGGKIWVESGEGKGTAVIFTLPI